MKCKALLLISFIVLLLSQSCSYKGALKSDLYNNPEPVKNKISANVVVSQSDRHISAIRTSGGLGDSYYIEVKEGILGSVRRAMADIFEQTWTSTDKFDTKQADFLVETIFEANLVYKDNWTGTQIFQTTLGIILRKFNTETEVRRYYDKQKVTVEPTAETKALSALTGASLFLLAPITIPAATQVGGNHGVTLLEQTLGKSLNGIVADIQRDRESILFAKSGNNEDIPSASKSESRENRAVASIYDDFLNSVVILRNSDGIGTGFFIRSDGLIISNSHVVGKDSTISVKLRNGSTLLGNVLARDEVRDLALIKVQGNDYSWLTMAEFSEIKIGTDILAIGTPEKFGWSVSKGTVSAVRNLGNIDILQTDAAINRGNSGGPVIDLKSGKVLGIVTFGFKKHIAEGLNFAICANEATKAFPQIRKIK